MRRIRWAYAVVFVPLLMDWVDPGFFPHNVWEAIVEIVAGLLLGVLVWRLYRVSDHYRSLSETDPLTGLPNRRRFEEDLARELRRVGGSPLSVGFADVDDFKAINDLRGHEAGDEVLRSVARAMDLTLRRTDRVYRIGGDEFAIILAGAPASQARGLLRGLRQELARTGVTLSVGVEQVRPGDNLRALMRRADTAMYEEKAAGKRATADRRAQPRLA